MCFLSDGIRVRREKKVNYYFCTKIITHKYLTNGTRYTDDP